MQSGRTGLGVGLQEASIARDGETELEMVRRHVREGEAHLVRQREILATLPPNSDLAVTAHQLLTLLEGTQELHQAHLDRLLRSEPEAGV